MDGIYSCDKNKIGKILEKINILIDETPNPEKNLLRYVFKNEEKSVWEANYLFILSSSGVIIIYDKEIDVDGENIFHLQLIDERKFYRFKKEFVDNLGQNSHLQPDSADTFQDSKPLDTKNVTPKGKKPKYVTEGGIGYVRFGKKQSEPFKRLKSRQWRMVKLLIDTFGVARSDKILYEEIKLPSDPKHYPELADPYREPARIGSIIDTTIGEIQRNFASSPLSNTFSIHHNQGKVWMTSINDSSVGTP